MTLSNIAIPSLDEAAAHAAATAEEQAMLDQAFSRRDGLLAQLESALASPCVMLWSRRGCACWAAAGPNLNTQGRG